MPPPRHLRIQKIAVLGFRRFAASSRSDLAAASALPVAARRVFSAGDVKSTGASIIVSTQHRSEDSHSGESCRGDFGFRKKLIYGISLFCKK